MNPYSSGLQLGAQNFVKSLPSLTSGLNSYNLSNIGTILGTVGDIYGGFRQQNLANKMYNDYTSNLNEEKKRRKQYEDNLNSGFNLAYGY
jgi:hypothetical protein